MRKIVLFPVILLLRIMRLIVSKLAQLYAMVGVWLWALVIFGIIYNVIHQQWSQVIIFTLVGVVSFAVLFMSVILETSIEEMERILS